MLSDKEIRNLCENNQMIEPFINTSIKKLNGHKAISYGLSSYGYDIRMAPDLKLLQFGDTTALDPKSFDETMSLSSVSDYTIPGNCGALTYSVEYFKIPDNVMAICLGKSTYARCGLIVNVTPLEAGWEGHLTIELVNTNPFPLKVYPMEGIAQLLFFENEDCLKPYNVRSGKYQGQVGVTGAKV